MSEDMLDANNRMTRELAEVDAALADRLAIDHITGRVEKILAIIMAAKVADPQALSTRLVEQAAELATLQVKFNEALVALEETAITLRDRGKNAVWECDICHQWSSANEGEIAEIRHEDTCLLHEGNAPWATRRSTASGN
jgi:hypothetical protein